MLRWNPRWRFAESNSPEREERLLAFSTGGGNLPPEGPETPDEGNEGPEQPPRNEERIRRITDAMRRGTEKAVNQARGKEAERRDPIVFFNAGEDFKVAYEKRYGRLQENQTLPASFSHEGVIYFNPAHPSFQDEATRKRTMTLELAEFYAKREEREDSDVMLKVRGRIREAGEWELLKEKVQELSGDRGSEIAFARTMLAVYIAGDRQPYDEDHMAGRDIVGILRPIVQKDTFLRKIVGDVRRGVNIEYENNIVRFRDAVGEQGTITEEADVVEERTDVPDEDLRNAAEAAREQTEESMRDVKNPEDVLKEIASTKEDVQDVQKSLREAIAKSPAGERANMERASLTVETYLQEVTNDLAKLERTTEALRDWEKPAQAGGISLQEKRRIGQELKLSNYRDYEQELPEDIIQAADNANRGERQEAVQKILNVLTVLNTPLNHITTMIRDIPEEASEENPEKRTDTWKTKVNTILSLNGNIRWMSPYDMIKLLKVYQEAFKGAYESQQRLRVNDAVKGSMGILGYLPYGSVLEQVLKKQVRSTNDEETNKYAEYMKSEAFGYDQIFPPGGLLDQNRINVNRAKAIIEYAADRGWLYKLDSDNPEDVYGINYKKEFGVQTFRELVDRNERGKANEQSEGEKRVTNFSDIAPIIKAIEEALHEKNLWRVHGMLKAIQRKGKIAHGNTLGLVTLMRALRDSKTDVLSIMESNLLDSIGGIGIEQSAWSLTLFKAHRKEIMDWKKRGGDFADVPGFTLAKAMKQIEEMVPDTVKHDRHRLDEIVAQVLAGQTAILRDGKGDEVEISLFQNIPAFNKFREYRATNVGTTKPGETDDDFFNPDNGASDVLLMPVQAVELILTRSSPGPFQYSPKAENFLASVLMRYDELERLNDQSAFINFKKEMGGALTHWADQISVIGNSSSFFVKDKTKTYKQRWARPYSNLNILEELKNRELISPAVYAAIHKKAAGGQTTPSKEGTAQSRSTRENREGSAAAEDNYSVSA